MHYKKTIIVVIVILFIMIFVGRPDKRLFKIDLKFIYAEWDITDIFKKEDQTLKKDETYSFNNNSLKNKGEITITSLSVQKIYNHREDVKASYSINNTLGMPYNMTINWINKKNNKVYPKWYYYNDTKEVINSGIIGIQIQNTGEWIVQMIIKHDENNTILTDDEITAEFRVI